MSGESRLSACSSQLLAGAGLCVGGWRPRVLCACDDKTRGKKYKKQWMAVQFKFIYNKPVSPAHTVDKPCGGRWTRELYEWSPLWSWGFSPWKCRESAESSHQLHQQNPQSCDTPSSRCVRNKTKTNHTLTTSCSLRLVNTEEPGTPDKRRSMWTICQHQRVDRTSLREDCSRSPVILWTTWMGFTDSSHSRARDVSMLRLLGGIFARVRGTSPLGCHGDGKC